MYDDDGDEEEAMSGMLRGMSAQAPEKPAEREPPEQVIGQIKSMVAELQELASKL